jgi:UDP-2-acetamido-2-deoxy-ribo-hexuluronate aminotransferase
MPKLAIFDEEIGLRQEVARRYDELLGNLGLEIETPVIGPGNTSVYAQYTILSPDRDRLQAKLGNAGIPSVPYYAVPLHLQPVFSHLGRLKGDFPVTEKVSAQCLSLPMSPYVKREDQERIAGVLRL